MPFDLDSMNETDVREVVVRPLLERLGYRHGTEHNIRTEVSLRYSKVFLGRTGPKDPDLAGRADYVCEVTPFGRWVVEAKAPSQPINAAVVAQAHTYAAHPEIGASMFLVCNGRRFEVYRTGYLQKPILAWAVEETDKNFLEIHNLLSPHAIEKMERAIIPEAGKPIGPGAGPSIRLLGGNVRYAEHRANHPFLADSNIAGLELPVTSGSASRDGNGEIVAIVETADAYPTMQMLTQLTKPKGGLEFRTTDEFLSSDRDRPSILTNYFESFIPAGFTMQLPGQQPFSLPMSIECSAYTKAVGYLDNGWFRGTMELEYAMSLNWQNAFARQQFVQVLGKFDDQATMYGTGDFEIEYS